MQMTRRVIRSYAKHYEGVEENIAVVANTRMPLRGADIGRYISSPESCTRERFNSVWQGLGLWCRGTCGRQLFRATSTEASLCQTNCRKTFATMSLIETLALFAFRTCRIRSFWTSRSEDETVELRFCFDRMPREREASNRTFHVPLHLRYGRHPTG